MPFRDKIHIQLPNPPETATNLNIYDSAGKKVFSSQIKPQQRNYECGFKYEAKLKENAAFFIVELQNNQSRFSQSILKH